MSYPEFKNLKLLATDFDNTYAMTSEPSPSGMTVDRAYAMAIESLFGTASLIRFNLAGGLKNRSPSEVVSQLEPDLDDDAHCQKTDDLVQAKLDKLISEVGRKRPDGSRWPRLAPGFSPLWHMVALDPDVDTAVISSGHRSFIERFHEVHELPLPDHLLTDDDTRPLIPYMPKELCVKPSGLLMEWVHCKWLAKHSMGGVVTLAESKSQMVYVGDDTNKDGQMAENYGVDFVRIEKYHPEPGWRRLGSRLMLPGYLQEAA